MRSVFFGTPGAAEPSLRALTLISDVMAVITRPDAARGRSSKLMPSAIAEAATEQGIPTFKPSHRGDIIGILSDLGSFDVGVVVAFGMILTEEVLAYPRVGLVNVHFSLLPRWRGAAPVERAILAGDTYTGVSVMAMDAGLDTGGVIASESVRISSLESAGELTSRLSEIGASLLSETLPQWIGGSLQAVPQGDELATYAPKLTTAESRLRFTASASEVLRIVRAFQPRPGAHAYLGADRFKILEAAPGTGPRLSPGELAFSDGQLWVGAGDASVSLIRVQPAGKSAMDGVAWAHGRTAPLGYLA